MLWRTIEEVLFLSVCKAHLWWGNLPESVGEIVSHIPPLISPTLSPFLSVTNLFSDSEVEQSARFLCVPRPTPTLSPSVSLSLSYPLVQALIFPSLFIPLFPSLRVFWSVVCGWWGLVLSFLCSAHVWYVHFSFQTSCSLSLWCRAAVACCLDIHCVDLECVCMCVSVWLTATWFMVWCMCECACWHRRSMAAYTCVCVDTCVLIYTCVCVDTCVLICETNEARKMKAERV